MNRAYVHDRTRQCQLVGFLRTCDSFCWHPLSFTPFDGARAWFLPYVGGPLAVNGHAVYTLFTPLYIRLYTLRSARIGNSRSSGSQHACTQGISCQSRVVNVIERAGIGSDVGPKAVTARKPLSRSDTSVSPRGTTRRAPHRRVRHGVFLFGSCAVVYGK